MTPSDKVSQISTYGLPSNLLDEFNPETEGDLLNILKVASEFLKQKFRNKETRALVLDLFQAYSCIDSVERLLSYSVYINEFSNKNGKKYLQARTSYINAKGKKSWLNAYIGAIENFPKGTKDPIAFKLGKELIRKKLIEKKLCTLEKFEKKVV